MTLKSLLKWIYTKVSDYNVFKLDENEYDCINDPAIVIKHQKYKTWLYTVLLTVFLYILFYATLVKMHTEMIVVSDITLDKFVKLSSLYGEDLSCSCTTIALPLETFVFNNVTMHPLCQSIFVDKQWIDGLYFDNASSYVNWDFRKTAYSQFKFLSQFCSLSEEIIIQIEKDVNTTQLVSIELLSELDVQLQVDNIIQSKRESASGQTTSFLDYLKTTILGNIFVSALGTNYVFKMESIVPDTYNIFQNALLVFDIDTRDWLVCGGVNFIMATGFSSLSRDQAYYVFYDNLLCISDIPINTTLVKGFVTGCTPLEAILESTLDCLYEIECLQLLLNYFPKLNQMNVNWTNSILTTKHENTTVSSYLNNLFLQNWFMKINYSTYFDQCSPSQCTYKTQYQAYVSYAITIFISLYGGLIIIVRLLTSYVVDVLVQNRNIFKPTQSLKQLNLFKNIQYRTENDIKQQRITTRIYLILLFSSLCILCLFTTFEHETVIITVTNPSYAIYNSLENIYSTIIQCPCSNNLISQQKFLSFAPTFHQICSSGFVDDSWITVLQFQTFVDKNDWRARAFTQFQLLSDLCQLANKTINDAINRFLSQEFIASFVMNQIDFEKQINTSLNQFYQSTLYNFDVQKDITRLIMQVDQFVFGSTFSGESNSYADLVINTITDNPENFTKGYISFIPSGIPEINSTLIKCVCVLNPNCHNQAFIKSAASNRDIYDNITYIISSWMQSCLAIDALSLSTLEGLYDNSEIFPFLIYSVNLYGISMYYRAPLTFDLPPLDSHTTVTRFPHNATISLMIKEMMVEEWHTSLSYIDFYEACAPMHCSYPQSIRKQSFLGVIVVLVSMVGGIVVSLRILTPHLVALILRLFTRNMQNRRETDQIHRNCIDRLKTMVINLTKRLRTLAINLNIFTARDFDRVTVEHYGKWATRLYLILFLSGLTILLFYTIIEPHTVIRSFDKPSFSYYDILRKTYGDELKCTCSKIASTYSEFVEIHYTLHSICTSEFVSEEWRLDLVKNLVPNLIIYEQRDYRRFLSAHLQYLQGLCQLSESSVKNSIDEFLTSLLVTVQLLSKTDFETSLNILIERSRSNAPILLSRLLFVIQNYFRTNVFLSIYGTDFEFSIQDINNSIDPYLYAEPMRYDNDCSCAMSVNCTTQATFNKNISIHGMKMGCTPSESFLVSTLECFYNQSCLNLIQQYTNYSNTLIPLTSQNTSRFLPNTTITELINKLFIENWSTQMNYLSYYEQCSPSLCSYTSVENFNIFYSINFILGIQGGLTIVLKWLCPKLIRIAIIMNQKRKNRIRSSHVITITTVETSQTNVMSPFCKIICVIFILSMLVGIITFSIYYARDDTKEESITNVSITNSLTTTISSSISTYSNISSGSFICKPQFEYISMNLPCSNTTSAALIIVDINSDDKYDFIFYCHGDQTLNVLFGNDNNGTFEESSKYFFNNIVSVPGLLSNDLNNDNRLDLILIYKNESNSQYYFGILFGDDNGTFQVDNMKSIVTMGIPQKFVLVDLDNDNKLDIVSANTEDKLEVMFGNGNGTFLPSLTLRTGDDSTRRALVVGDFNNDNYTDIAVFNEDDLCIHIFLANANRNLWSHTWMFTKANALESTVVSGEFLGNNQTSIVVVSNMFSTYAILYRYNNGIFHSDEQMIELEGEYTKAKAAVACDLNGDQQLDILITEYISTFIYAFFGVGAGKFENQQIFGRDDWSYRPWIYSIDLNQDNCPDIVSMDIANRVVDMFFNTCECHTH